MPAGARRAALFDLDDTLVDQQPAADAAVLAWAAQEGLAVDSEDDLVVRWRRLTDDHFARYQRREISFVEQRRARVRAFLGRPAPDGEADELFHGYLVRYEAGWRLFDDVLPALRRARGAGCVVAVLTNGDETQQRQKVDRLGIAQEIDALIASSALPAGKPDARAFHGALARIRVSPDRALMIGDSLENDVLGAQAAGVEAILLDRGGQHSGARVRTVRGLDQVRFGPSASPSA